MPRIAMRHSNRTVVCLMGTALKIRQATVTTNKHHATSNEQMQYSVLQDPDSSPRSPSADADHQQTRRTFRLTGPLTIVPPRPPKPIFQLSEMIEFAQRDFASRSLYTKTTTFSWNAAVRLGIGLCARPALVKQGATLNLMPSNYHHS